MTIGSEMRGPAQKLLQVGMAFSAVGSGSRGFSACRSKASKGALLCATVLGSPASASDISSAAWERLQRGAKKVVGKHLKFERGPWVSTQQAAPGKLMRARQEKHRGLLKRRKSVIRTEAWELICRCWGVAEQRSAMIRQLTQTCAGALALEGASTGCSAGWSCQRKQNAASPANPRDLRPVPVTRLKNESRCVQGVCHASCPVQASALPAAGQPGRQAGKLAMSWKVFIGEVR